MTVFWVDYASPSAYQADRSGAIVGLSANARRPVRFVGRVKEHVFLLRVALRALGEAIWSDDTWIAGDILDPVVTVHPDRLFFEAFSRDQSSYAALILDPALFDTSGEVTTGTTNIDFTAWLWGALGEMRSSRDTTFRIGSEGFEVSTAGAGGRFEAKVDIPDDWVRGFLQLQAAMAMPGTRLTVRPVDLLSAIRFMRFTKAKVSPRALRYVFVPGQDAELVLEPWERVVPLRGASHSYAEERVIRTWGRRRLRLIEGLLPFAESVTIYLKGRALPSFYAVKLPGMTFVLGLSGWSSNGWTTTGGFDLLAEAAAASDADVPRVLALLEDKIAVRMDDIAKALSLELPAVSRAVVRLCRQGRAIFDVETRQVRHRELFETPPPESVLFPPDRRRELAAELVDQRRVEVSSCQVEESRKTRRLKTPEGPVFRDIIYRDWRVRGRVGDQPAVEIAVNDLGRIIFGTCGCHHFAEHLLNLGPCEHMLALFQGSAELRVDSASSERASASQSGARHKPTRWEIESGEVEGVEAEERDD